MRLDSVMLCWVWLYVNFGKSSLHSTDLQQQLRIIFNKNYTVCSGVMVELIAGYAVDWLIVLPQPNCRLMLFKDWAFKGFSCILVGCYNYICCY